MVDFRVPVSDYWRRRFRSFNQIGGKERRVVELTAVNFKCWVDDWLGIRAQPHPDRDMIRHAFMPLSMGDAQNLMRELQLAAGLNGKANATRRPDIIIELCEVSVLLSECIAVIGDQRCRDLADWAPRRVRRRHVEIASKKNRGAFKALIQAIEVGS